jgi:hypothetical protein
MNLHIYMDSWIIGDGNYADFSVGETRQFALEFWAPSLLSRTQNQESSITADPRYTYHVNARVAFSNADILVIDFGLLAYSEASADLQLGFGTGDFVTGDIRLGVDPFFYFERLSKLQGVPPLVYEWRIDLIQQETTPMIIGEICGRRGYVRDESRTSFAQVESTQDVIPNPNDVAPSYVLHCTKLETAPMRQFSRPQRW